MIEEQGSKKVRDRYNDMKPSESLTTRPLIDSMALTMIHTLFRYVFSSTPHFDDNTASVAYTLRNINAHKR
jgi:hypothetical protein